MKQEIKNELENWFISNEEDFTKLFAFNIESETIAKVTNNKYSYLSTKLKEEYCLGIIAKLPEIEDLTEIIINNKLISLTLNRKQIKFREKLNITKQFYLTINNEQVLPSRSELQELIIEGIDILKENNNCFVAF